MENNETIRRCWSSFTLSWFLLEEGEGKEKRESKGEENKEGRQVVFASVSEKLLVRCSVEEQVKRVAPVCPNPETYRTVELGFKSF